MDNEIFLRLLRSSFDIRNTQILKRFIQEKNSFGFQNKLNLSSNIELLHAIVKMELEESSDIIVETAFHIVKTEYLISNYTQIRKACSSAFIERAAEIEEIFLQRVVYLETEAQNTEILNPYAPLTDFEFMQLMKINDKVSEAYQERTNHPNCNLPSVKTKQPVLLSDHLITLTIFILICITYIA